jgi:hypothetical protein
MDNIPSDNGLIEKYILGKLTSKEIQDFEIRLDEDREFARKFRLIKMFPEMMSEQGKLEYDRMLAEASAPVEQKKAAHSIKSRYIIWFSVSALIVIAVVLLFIFLGSNQKQENVVSEEKAQNDTTIVKPKATPVKDTTKVVPVQQPEVKTIPAIATGTSQKPIELITPADGMSFSRTETILFTWTQKVDTFTRFYIVSQSTDQVAYWRGVRLGVRELKVPGNYFYPGKYYWYVANKDEKRTFTINE